MQWANFILLHSVKFYRTVSYHSSSYSIGIHLFVHVSCLSGPLEKTGSLEIIPENCPLDPAGRLSISLDDHNVSSGPSSCGSPSGGLAAGLLPPHRAAAVAGTQTLGRVQGRAELARAGRYRGDQQQPGRGHEMKSYTCLPQVRDRDTCTSTPYI